MSQSTPSDANAALLERAERVIPGGVNSPVRAFRSVGGIPKFIARGEGAFLISESGERFIDYICSWGPLILGHNAPIIRQAIDEALSHGTSFGAPTAREVRFAELLVELLPGVEMIRMVSSGTEAMMSLARLARGYSSRPYLIKCDGCYHGHADSFLVQAGSGAATQGVSGSAGVLPEVVAATISVPFNDLGAVESVLRRYGPQQFAAIVVEPVPGNMGLILPNEGYLESLRTLCSEHGILLIFDEVMSGFRVALGGAAARFKVTPDLVAYGKVIGGGLPAAAFGGRADIMRHLAPLGPVYQAGTLSGNPLAVAAGLAVVSYLAAEDPYAELERRAQRLMQGFAEAANRAGIPLQTSVCGSMFGFFFSETRPQQFADVQASDLKRFNSFFHQMLERGVYLAPSAFEAGFLSLCHDEEVIASSCKAAEASFQALLS